MKKFIIKCVKLSIAILLVGIIFFTGLKLRELYKPTVSVNSFNITTSLDQTIENSSPLETNSIEDKIHSTFIKDNIIPIECYAQVNQNVYAIIELNNKKDFPINYLIINNIKYDSLSYEKGSSNQLIKIKMNVGSQEGVKEYKLTKLSYTHANKEIIIDVIEKNVNLISIGTVNDISVSINNENIDNLNYNFDLTINDPNNLISNDLGEMRVLLYDGNDFTRNIKVESDASITFDNLIKDKTYQFAIVLISNENQLSILDKHTFYTREYSITLADVSNGKITLKNKAYGNAKIDLTSSANHGYKLNETYYIEEGKTEKIYFKDSFKMPLNNITVYATFEKGYTINSNKTSYINISVDNVGIYQEKINVVATSTHYSKIVSEMYYTELGKSEKHYFWGYFIMPKTSVTIYAVLGDTINIRNAHEFNVRLREEKEKNVEVILLNDIDLGGIEWEPIGDKDNPYTGGINGNNHTISNFKITTAHEYTGLFGYISKPSNGTLSYFTNLNVENFMISFVHNVNTDIYVGGLSGYVASPGLSNLTTDGKIMISGNTNNVYVGGLFGYFYGELDLRDSNSETDITINTNNLKAYAGGLIGYVEKYSADKMINNSYATGTVYLSDTINSYRGEIIAYIDAYDDKVLENCYENIATIEIYNKEDLLKLQGNNSGNYKLMNDINLNGAEWIPINFYGGGSFDGNNHKIYNFKITTSRVNNGLFGFVSHATIKDLTITDVIINYTFKEKAELTYAGILVGNSNNLKLDNIFVKGNITINTTSYKGINAAGIAASVGDNSSITNCKYEGNITLDAYYRVISGGVVGNISNSTISNSHSTSNIKSTYGEIGGLVGTMNFGEIETSSSNTTIQILKKDMKSSISIGGFIGSSLDSNISDCYATGSININQSNYSKAGGFIGAGSISKFTNLYTTVDINVTIEDPYLESNIGGFVGGLGYSSSKVSEFINCYTLSNIYTNIEPTKLEIGGFSGEIKEGTIYTNSYKYNSQVIDASGAEINDIGVAMSKENIWQYISNNWDNDIWNLYSDKNPSLK